jgi:aspartate racemase
MIGIVGGVGTFAGIDLYRKIYQHTDARTDQDHPPVALLSIPHRVLDRTEFLLGKVEDNPGVAIAGIIKALVSVGAEVIGIPCNTAHTPVIFEEIKKGVPSGAELLNMVEEVGRQLSEKFPDIRKAGILGTTGTYMSQTYTRSLAHYQIEAIYPERSEQDELVHQAIYDKRYGIKAFSDPVTDRARNDLMDAARSLIGKGAEAIVLACTEIPLAIPESRIDRSVVIDSVAVLAQALIHKSRSQ